MNLSGADQRARCDHAGGHIANLIHGGWAGGGEKKVHSPSCEAHAEWVGAEQGRSKQHWPSVSARSCGARRWKGKWATFYGSEVVGRPRETSKHLLVEGKSPACGCAYWILEDQANWMIHRFRRTIWNPVRPFGASRLEVSWAAIKGNDRPVKNLVGVAGCCEDFGEGDSSTCEFEKILYLKWWSLLRDMRNKENDTESSANYKPPQPGWGWNKTPFFLCSSCWSQSAVSSQHRFMSSLLGTFIFKHPPPNPLLSVSWI